WSWRLQPVGRSCASAFDRDRKSFLSHISSLILALSLVGNLLLLLRLAHHSPHGQPLCILVQHPGHRLKLSSSRKHFSRFSLSSVKNSSLVSLKSRCSYKDAFLTFPI